MRPGHEVPHEQDVGGKAGLFDHVEQGIRVTAAGVAVGLLAAFAMVRTIAAFLYGVEPTDPLTFGGVALALVAVGGVACYLPARRATRVDPIAAMRAE